MIHICFRKGGHPAYEEIFNYPPDGVIYHEIKFLRGMETPFVPLKHKIKRFLFKVYSDIFLNVNAVPIFCRGDVIYSCGMMVKSNKPWVCDFEHVVNIIGGLEYRENLRRIRVTVKHIKKSKCKLLPWSFAALKSAEYLFGNRFKEIKDKFEVVYPAMHVDKFPKKTNKKDEIVFLYVNRVFWLKCGLETLLAFNEVSKKYDAKMIFLSSTPEDIKRKFIENKNVIFIDAPVQREKVFELYRSANVFVLPTLSDTFGFVYLEALAFGLPIIATRVFAVPEIVEHEKNGLIVEPEYQAYNEKYDYILTPERIVELSKNKIQYKLVERLKEAMIWIIENDREREKFGKHSRYLVEKGKFSIDYRNKKLKEIFEKLINKYY